MAEHARRKGARSQTRGHPGQAVIVDPGLDHRHGHHVAVNVGVAGALLEQGFGCLLLASSALEEGLRKDLAESGIEAVPFFVTPTYPPDVETLDAEAHVGLARAFAAEIENGFKAGSIPRNSFLVFHTVYAFQISGLAQALFKLPAGTVRGVYIALMFDPGMVPVADYGISPDVLDAGRYLKYRTTLKLLDDVVQQKQVPLALDTSCESYRRAFSRLIPEFDVGIHPIATVDARVPIPAPAESDRVLLYLGCPKGSKGIRFALHVARQLRDVHPHIKQVFHFNRKFHEAWRFLSDVEGLRARGGVEIIEDHLAQDRYLSLIAGAGTLCILYDPTYYAFKTSGILWDGLRNPRLKFVVTKDTWMERELIATGRCFRSVGYGCIVRAAEEIAKAVAEGAPLANAQTASQRAYSDLLLQSFGRHVAERLTTLGGGKAGAAHPILPVSIDVPRDLGVFGAPRVAGVARVQTLVEGAAPMPPTESEPPAVAGDGASEVVQDNALLLLQLRQVQRELEDAYAQLQFHHEQLQGELKGRNRTLKRFRNSRSWRATAPLRAFAKRLPGPLQKEWRKRRSGRGRS